MASAISNFPLTFKSSSLPFNHPSSLLSLSSPPPSPSSSSAAVCWVSAHISNGHKSVFGFKHFRMLPFLGKKRQSLCPSIPCSCSSFTRLICRASEYKFPDPIPEFADAETEKFRNHLSNRLFKKKKDLFGDSLDEVVGICTEIFGNFLHAEYGGPGTLLVEPFIDMADALKERGLPGGPQAARAAVKWAQDHVDKDWKEWTTGNGNQ